MSLKSEMNALADQVRRLSGKTGKMTITAMTNNLKGVNAEPHQSFDLNSVYLHRGRVFLLNS